MNLAKLIEVQRKLDEHIIDEHPELRGQNNLDWKIFALQVELGECANEWRGFKKWSKNQRPRTETFVECKACQGYGDANYEMIQEDAEGSGDHEYLECDVCNGSGSVGPKNPLLEEYVDCLHFILSIGLEIEEINPVINVPLYAKESSIGKQFLLVSEYVLKMQYDNYYEDLINVFLCLGEMLGFTWEQIEQAYMDKNKINHQRQERGY